jgi:hypothetical protein
VGDEPTLAPSAHFYQRLLAMDDEEAREVLKTGLKDGTLEDVYESILVPALSLAEQDRHRNQLDEVTGKFISQSTRELIEDLYENCNRIRDANSAPNHGKTISQPPGMTNRLSDPVSILCLPARDEADEIVGIMLSQLLERAGYRSEAISLDGGAEALAAASQWEPDIICLSALPPFAVSHAQSRYKELHANFPLSRIVVGLWNFSGDLRASSRRMGLLDDDVIVTRLSQVIQIIDFLVEPGTGDGRDSATPVRSGQEA